MNYKIILNTLGKILKLEAVLMFFPLIVSLIYQENTYLSFLIPISALLMIGELLTLKKPDQKEFFAKEGFIIVGLSWIIMSLFGCLPFVFSKEIPNFIDAFFEIVSGFTTTGASILSDVEALSKGMLFWRSFSHWIGGMGILVFMLALLPSTGQNIHILRAESPGPQVGKMVSKIKLSARILYIIYICLTIIQIVMLLFGGMELFDALTISFGTAGTGGFASKNSSMADYNSYCQVVTTIFMFLFGLNFNVYFFCLIGNFKQALKSEEVYWYFGIVIVAITIITTNLCLTNNLTFGKNLKDAAFQVVSIVTTTGFATTNFDNWSAICQIVLFLLMFVGACSSSTGGGLKVSRVVIMLKNSVRQVRQLIHPNSITSVRFEDQKLEENVIKSVTGYFSVFMIIYIILVLIISIDGFDFKTNLTAVAACINNIGPGLGKVGPIENFGGYSPLSKIALIFAMLIGRLEIFPLLIVFSPRAWMNK